ERFGREVATVARLKHPGIVPIHMVGEERGTPYFAMEWIEGCTLAEVLKHVENTPPATLTARDLARAIASHATPTPVRAEALGQTWVECCLRLAKQVCEALQHAHDRGVLHRDLKPSNIVVTPDGRAMLVDFGLARSAGATRITRTGSQLGSLPYMA